MATSADASWLLTATRILWQGRLRSRWGLLISADGQILASRPLRPGIDTPAISLEGKVLLSGQVDAFAPSAYLSVTPDKTATVPQSARAIYAQLRNRFLLAALQGITCLGIPHVASHHGAQAAGKSLFPLADLIVAAAHEVGIRVALLDDVTPALTEPVASLDAMIARFHALVGHLLSYNDPLLSWALFISRPERLGDDGLLGLKVRMAHMPLVVHLQKNDADATLGRWYGSGLLDAATSVLLPAWPAPERQSQVEASGAPMVLDLGRADKAAPPSACDAIRQYGRAFALASGHGSAVNLWPQSLSLCAPHQAAQWLRIAQQGGGAALSLRCPGWTNNRWADLYALDWDEHAQPHEDDDARLERLLAQAVGHPAPASDVMIGGRFIVRDGQHRLSRP